MNTTNLDDLIIYKSAIGLSSDLEKVSECFPPEEEKVLEYLFLNALLSCFLNAISHRSNLKQV